MPLAAQGQLTPVSFAMRDFCLPKILGKLMGMTRQDATPEQLARLAQAVEERRAALRDRSYDEIHAAGGPSTTTMTKIRLARPPAPQTRTLDALDRGLDWEPGSAYAVLWHGEEPRPIHPALGGEVAGRVLDLMGGGSPLRRLVRIRDQLSEVIEDMGRE